MFKHRKSLYIPGDHLIESDLTGRICRASETRKLWSGQICHRDEYEHRNPQDFLQAQPEREPFRDSRPRSVNFIASDEEITGDDL